MTDPSPVTWRQRLDASRAEVWAALTDPAQMEQWYFEEIEEFRAEVGFETQFTVVNEVGEYVHRWRVTEVEPNERLVYAWRYEGLEGKASTTWTLAEDDGQTVLELVHEGIHTFPQDDPAFTREACEGGWRYFLGERLPAFLSG